MTPIAELLRAVSTGELSIAEAQRQLESREISAIDGATLDTGRTSRCGFGEVVYGEGKPPELIGRIAVELLDRIAEVLITRVSPSVYSQIDVNGLECRYCEQARTLRIARTHSPLAPEELQESNGQVVAVVSAGSTDEPVAQEAAETLAWMGVPVRRMTDVGVAGPYRLLAGLDTLDGCAAAIVVAGMEGALTSVVAGHVPYPVIGVPTSVGYGASMGGITATLSMLTSCAANVAVVNIDAGFKGGYLAGLIACGNQPCDPQRNE